MRTARPSDAMIIALPMAAAGTLLLASWLPVRFEYRENTLGIVSLSTLQRYPVQQESFWLAFAVLCFGLLAWALARFFGRKEVGPGTQAIALAFSALALASMLWFPGAAGVLGCGAAAAAALALVWRAPAAEPPAATPAPPDRRGATVRRLMLVSAAVALSLILTPSLWLDSWDVVNGTPDSRLVSDDFNFHAEIGQHLAWADAIRRGELHGRDFFCLYGPLYDMALAGLWELTGRSIAAYKFYISFGRAISYVVGVLLCAVLVRRRSLVLLLPLLLPWTYLRIGLPMAGLLLLALWSSRRKRRLSLAAGLVAGASLLYSQEFGLAFLISAAAGFAVLREGRAAAAFAIGLGVPLTAVLGWFAVQGALGPMLSDLVQYPRYMFAGFGKLPFPSLVAGLPLPPPRDEEALLLRVGYSTPLICAAALLIAAPVASLSLRHPLLWLRETREAFIRDPLRFGAALLALFGLLSFRSALGRSDLLHVMMLVAPSALLLLVGLDRLIGCWLANRARRSLVATRAAALVLLAAQSGLADAAQPLRSVNYSTAFVEMLAFDEYAPVGSLHVQQVRRWLLTHVAPDDPVLFLPNSAAYYYLTRRASPIRFVLGHQIVTDAHRAEVLAALRARPPRFVVWEGSLLDVDGIEPRLFLGAPILDWIERSYMEEARFGKARILRRQDAEGTADR